MARRLASDEAALWALVTATVRPLHPVKPATPGEAPPAPIASPQRRSAGPVKPARPAPPPSAPVTAPPAETLDGSWDRRISSGKLSPDRTIDLHGMTSDSARQLLYREVSNAEALGQRILLVITGKGHMPGPAPADLVPGLARPGHQPRGAIRVSLPRWLGEAGLSHRIAAVRRAHPRHGGMGAAYIILKRQR